MSDSTARDILYFDFEKAASIWSQIAGGLQKDVSIAQEGTQELGGGLKVGIPNVIQANFGGLNREKTSILETKVLHHDLLNLVEGKLADDGLVGSLQQPCDGDANATELLRGEAMKHPYLRATGWAVIEDAERMRFLTERFNQIALFVMKCSSSGKAESMSLLDDYEATNAKYSQAKDKNAKNAAKTKLKRLKQDIKNVFGESSLEIDEWLLEGIRMCISTFLGSRVVLRLFPCDKVPEFQLVCSLKRGCFVDQDLEHLLAAYGKQPTVRLSVFGLVTSTPAKEGPSFDPMSEYLAKEKDRDLVDKKDFEKAWRAMFPAIDGIGEFFHQIRYPRVAIHPIAVFRELSHK